MHVYNHRYALLELVSYVNSEDSDYCIVERLNKDLH